MIKLKTLGFEHAAAVVCQKIEGNKIEPYQTRENGTDISHVFWQQQTGVLGGVRLGIEDNVWVPYVSGLDIKRGDRIYIEEMQYEIKDIKKHFIIKNGTAKSLNRVHEPHWVLNITDPNDS